jgi:Kef-type K+ transport system membrane component KefB
VNTEELMLSIGVILLAARTLGRILQRIGQPRVVGEITAGIALGPSLLGRFCPISCSQPITKDWRLAQHILLAH